MTTEFKGFGKIARLSRACVITEKIDGTNAQIFLGEDGEFLTGSRTRWITPGDDNFGFSRWAHDHEDELLALGPGHHYGEYWGKGIQRNYGLTERRFSLFNVARWGESRPACCDVVPVLYRGLFSTEAVEIALGGLLLTGSRAAPGFMKPEGVVVFHSASGHLYKKTIEHDDEPKNAHVKKERLPQTVKPHAAEIMWTGGRRHGATTGYTGSERRVA